MKEFFQKKYENTSELFDTLRSNKKNKQFLGLTN